MSKSITFQLAKRFLLSKNSDRFLSLMSWVSITGVALGVVALVTVTSVINGFEFELTRAITGMNGDVILYSRADPISNPQAVETKIRKVLPNVQAVTQSFVTEMMASGPHGVAGIVLEGFDAKTADQVTSIFGRMKEGRAPVRDFVLEGETSNKKMEVALGDSLAERIGAKVGDTIRLIAPFAEEGDAKVTEAQVVGIFRMGMFQYDSKFTLAPIESVRSFLEQKDEVTSFKIKLPTGLNAEEVRAASNRLNEHFGFPFRAKDWGQLNRNLFYAIQLEKVVIAILLTTIVIVAAFNVVSTLMMMIYDKTKEISILKAMGLRKKTCFQLFSSTGMFIGVTGTILGLMGGLFLNFIIERGNFIELPADVYYVGLVAVVVRWADVGLIVLVALVISFLSTFYPSFQVARRSPLDGLRYE